MSRSTIVSHSTGVAAVALGIAALAITGGSAAATQQQDQVSRARAASASDGERLYYEVGCAQCHGAVGQGGSAGPALAGRQLPLAFYDAQVRNPVDAMPPYTRKVLSDEELRAIYDFVLAMKP